MNKPIGPCERCGMNTQGTVCYGCFLEEERQKQFTMPRERTAVEREAYYVKRIAELEAENADMIEMLWTEYGAEDPEKLTPMAIELRDKLRKVAGVAELEAENAKWKEIVLGDNAYAQALKFRSRCEELQKLICDTAGARPHTLAIVVMKAKLTKLAKLEAEYKFREIFQSDSRIKEINSKYPAQCAPFDEPKEG